MRVGAARRFGGGIELSQHKGSGDRNEGGIGSSCSVRQCPSEPISDIGSGGRNERGTREGCSVNQLTAEPGSDHGA